MLQEERLHEMLSDMGYLKARVEDLSKDLREHMESEEKERAAIYKVLGLLALIIGLQFMGLSGPEIVEWIKGLL